MAVVVALGLLAIVGSGGGGEAANCSFFSDTCVPGGGTMPPPAVSSLERDRIAVQVGGTVGFSVRSNVEQPSYRWCRVPAGSTTCTEIAGATEPSYTVVGANLGDDGASFRVTVTGSNGTTWSTGRLAVSSMPGVHYQDGEFLESDWTTTQFVEPAVDAPSVDLARETAGGHPGAFRAATYLFRRVPSSVRVFYSAHSAVYDPAVQGAVYVIDMTEDCLQGDGAGLLAFTGPMIEQAGRRYRATGAGRACLTANWTAVQRSVVGVEDFRIVDGPACGTGESCPDFSASGAAIRLGLLAESTLTDGLPPPVQVAHGFDNWKLTIWRR